MKSYDDVIVGTEPVTGTELAASLRATDPSDVARCAAYVIAARGLVESYCGIFIVRRTVTLYMDTFLDRQQPKGDNWWDGVRDGAIMDMYCTPREIEIPRPPLISVTSVTAFDDSDNTTIMDASQYIVDVSSKKKPGRVVLRRGEVWPSVALRSANGVRIIYEAGYVNGAVPEELKQAILLVGGKLYADRGDCGEGCVEGCGAGPLLATFKVLFPA